METLLIEKETKLLSWLQQYTRVAVAFSGGVDSSVVLGACKAAGIEVVPIFADTAAVPAFEKEDARRVASETGSNLVVIEFNPLTVSEFCENSPRRCYYCKKNLLQKLKAEAAKYDCPVILDGANVDDKGDYRPGMKAVQEEGILSPLLLAGLTKVEVRQLAAKYGLSVANKPAYACLASRVPYGDTITREKLQKIERAEAAVRALGFGNARVRCHGELARLELEPQAIETAAVNYRRELIEAVKAAGFLYVTLDLEGYRTGSLNEVINKKQ